MESKKKCFTLLRKVLLIFPRVLFFYYFFSPPARVRVLLFQFCNSRIISTGLRRPGQFPFRICVVPIVPRIQQHPTKQQSAAARLHLGGRGLCAAANNKTLNGRSLCTRARVREIRICTADPVHNSRNVFVSDRRKHF